MRILQLSDEHIDLYPAEAATMIGHAADHARQSKVDLIASCGDWYNGATTPETRRRGVLLMDELANAAPVVIVAGNHGAPKDLLTLVSRATANPVHVALEPGIIYLTPYVEGDIDHDRAFQFHTSPSPDSLLICCLPWLRKLDLATPECRAAGLDLGAVATEALARILEGFHAAIAAHPGPSLVVAHADVTRQLRSAGNPEVGEELVIPADWLANLGADYVALGHEHARQELARGVWYSGSPRRTTFGEREGKGIQIAELRVGGEPGIQFIDLPCARMETVEATWDADAQDFVLPSIGGVRPGDRIKVRWTVPEEQREAARQAYARHRRLMREAGADEVVAEERTVASRRARGGQAVATAKSTWDKCLALWRAQGYDPGPEALPALEALVGEAERAVGAAGPLARARTASVRWESIRLRNIGPFRDVAIDWTAMPGPLTALCGRSGEGKSTLLGALPALLYRDHPDGWALPDRAGEQASIEGRVVSTKTWDLQVKVNPRSRKMDGFAFDGPVPVEETTRGGTTGYDAFVARNFAPRDLFLSGPFAAQFGKADPIESLPTARKEQLVTALALDHFDRMAAWVKAQIAPPRSRSGERLGLRAEVERLCAVVDEARRRSEGMNEALDRVTARESDHELATRVLQDALDAAADALAAIKAHEDRLVEIRQAGAEARARVQAAVKSVEFARRHAGEALERNATVLARVERLQRDIADAERGAPLADQLPALQAALDAARAQEGELRDELERATADLATAKAEETSAIAAHRAVTDQMTRARAAEASAEQRVLDAEAAAHDLPIAEREAARVPDLTLALDQSRTAEAAARRASSASSLYDVERKARAVEAGRLMREASLEQSRGEGLRNRVASVPCGGPDVQPTCEFLQDAASVDLVSLARAFSAASDGATAVGSEPYPEGYVKPLDRAEWIAKATAEVEQAMAALSSARAAAARLPDLQRAAEAADRARAARDVAAQASSEVLGAIAQARTHRIALGQRVEDAIRKSEDLSDRLVLARCAAATADDQLSEARAAAAAVLALDRARRDLAGAQGELATSAADRASTARILSAEETGAQTASAEVERLLAEHKAGKASPPPGPDQARIDAARRGVQDAESAIAVARAGVELLEGEARALAEAEEARRLANHRLANAVVIEAALGRDGIQAMEIDAAAPAISDLVNDLLARCYGTRFTFRLDTQADKLDGKGVVEGLPMMVLDGTLPARQDGSLPWQEARAALSGGQRVVIGTAYRIATSIYTARLAARAEGTLCLDEYGAALDAESAAHYMRMLRRAVEIGGFDRVLFISHHAVMQEMADCRLEVSRGKVWLEGERELSGDSVPLVLESAA